MSADPPPARRRLLGTLARATAVTVFLGLAVGVAGYDSWRGGPAAQKQAAKPTVRPVLSPVLDGFGSCDDLLRYYRTNAASRVGPYGIEGTTLGGGPEFTMRAPAVPQAKQDAGATASTGTNVQVAGVDEADLMKLADGHLVSLTDGVLRISAIGGGTARLLGTLKPHGWMPQQLLLSGSRALLIGSQEPAIRGPMMTEQEMIRPGWMATVRLAEADLSDPAHPRLVRQLDLPGSLVGARLTGGHVQLAVSTNAGRLAWVYPDGKRTEAQATAANRRLVARSGLKDWLPRATIRDTRTDGTPTGTASTRDLLDCRQVSAPQHYAGLDTLSLLSLDLASGDLRNWTAAGLVASGATVYATATHTYVATTPWAALAADSKPLPGGATLTEGEFTRTQIHLFDTTDDVLQYVASGQVDGSLLGQFAMDEYQGRLRVASTLQPLTFPRLPGKVPPTSGKITVLEQDGRTLRTIGALGGLGRTESVQGVRFAGPVGYLVTFRQTDPLFTLDLADSRHPKLSGELKLLGYSAYLHPAGDGLLLGLGQDADATGRSRGLQLSLFDVADPAAPRRLSQVRLPGAWSDAEFDHHAFTFADGLVLTPFGQDGGFVADPEGKAGTHDAGVLAVRLDGRALGVPRLLRPVADGPVTVDYSKPSATADLVLRASPLRTAVLDGTVYTLTAAGIAAHDAGSGHRLGFTKFRTQ